MTYYTLDQNGRLVPTVTELTPNYLPPSSASPTASSTTSSSAAVTNGLSGVNLRGGNSNGRLLTTSNQNSCEDGLTNSNSSRYYHQNSRCHGDIECDSDQMKYLQTLTTSPFDPDLIQTHLKHRQIQTQPQLVVNTFHQLQHQARFYGKF